MIINFVGEFPAGEFAGALPAVYEDTLQRKRGVENGDSVAFQTTEGTCFSFSQDMNKYEDTANFSSAKTRLAYIHRFFIAQIHQESF